MNNMKQYQVLDEDGLYRMFDVSHDGLEDAIELSLIHISEPTRPY